MQFIRNVTPQGEPVANARPQEPLGLPRLYGENEETDGDATVPAPYAGAAGHTPVANARPQEPLGLPQLFGDDV